MNLQMTAGAGSETLFVLLLSMFGIVAFIEALVALTRSTVLRRTLWRVSMLAMLLLVVCELVGLGSLVAGTSYAVRARTRRPASHSIATPHRSEPSPPLPQVNGGAVYDDKEDYWEPLATNAQPLGPVQVDHTNSPVALTIQSDEVGDPVSRVGWPTYGVWLLALWFAGSAAALWRPLYRRLQLRRVTRHPRLITDVRLVAIVCQLSSRFRILRRIRLIESSHFPAPATFGVIRPMIVLPAGFSRECEEQHQAVMLAHELAHVAAYDALWLLVSDAVCVMLWWHPASWWSRSKLRQACESAADEASLLIPGGPVTLAECLVSLGRRFSDRRDFAWLSVRGLGFRSGLGRRVEHLLNLEPGSSTATKPRHHVLLTAVVVLLLVPLTFVATAWARTETTQDSGEMDMNMLKLSWRHSLAAAVVTPLLTLLSPDLEAVEAPAAPPSAIAAQERPQEPQRAAEGLRAQGALRELEERTATVERQLRELGDNHPDQAEALKRELGGIRERMQQLRRQGSAEAKPRVEVAIRELQGKISGAERALHELGDGQAEKAEGLKRELNEMREKLRALRQQSASSEREWAAGAVRELQQRASGIEQELRNLGDRHPDRAEALERELKGIRERMQQLQLQQRERTSERGVPENVVREIRERASALERELRELGDNNPERSEALRRELAAVRQRAQRLSGEAGRSDSRPERPQARTEERPAMARELEELRGQVREMRQEMESLRAEVRKLLEREGRDRK